MASALGIGGIVAIAALAGGSVVSTVSAIQEGKVQTALRRAEAKALKNQADIQAAQTDIEVAQRRRAAHRALGERRAGFSSSGLSLSGSVLDVLADASFEEELSIALAQQAGDVREAALRTQASITRFIARETRKAAIAKAIASSTGVGSSFSGSGLGGGTSSSTLLTPQPTTSSFSAESAGPGGSFLTTGASSIA